MIKLSNQRKLITKMSAQEARTFLLKPISYVSPQLPKYFNFQNFLKNAEKYFEGKNGTKRSLMDLCRCKHALSNTENVNYTLLINKDGRYDWRPVQIVHPILYVDLVNCIIDQWDILIEKFNEFSKNKKIHCISIPVESTGKKSDTEETILNWWENLEQASIKYSLDYQYCIKTDITNCYGSIYTHTLSWAIHGKNYSKEHKNDKAFKQNALGNILDMKIQNMQYGQTNGLPQGGVLFDLIAEIILGYADYQLSEILENEKIGEYKIIRYRDDYRIFSNKKEIVEFITKQLSEVLSDLNMHFNTRKTDITTDIVKTAIKKDKFYWTKMEPLIISKANGTKIYHLNLQKHLWQIYELSEKFPNSGSVIKL